MDKSNLESILRNIPHTSDTDGVLFLFHFPCPLVGGRETSHSLKRFRSCSTISSALVLQASTDSGTGQEFHYSHGCYLFSVHQERDPLAYLVMFLPGIFPKRVNCVHPGSSNAMSWFLCWKDIATNSRGYPVFYALKTNRPHLGGKKEASQASQGSFCHVFSLLSDLWACSLSKVSRKQHGFHCLCLRFPLFQVACHTWLIGRACLLREFAGSEGQIFIGALLPNDHSRVNTSE